MCIIEHLSVVRETRSDIKPVIAFDGKVLRGSYRNDRKSALQLVTAYDTERGLVLSQKPTATKNGEISVVRQMLEVLNVKGSVITVDALHCQRETLKTISDKKAHVVVQVKKNQPKLSDAVQSQFQSLFDAGKEKIVTEVKQEIHGRKEERYVFQLKAKLPETLAEKWITIRSVIAVERHRTINFQALLTSMERGRQKRHITLVPCQQIIRCLDIISGSTGG